MSKHTHNNYTCIAFLGDSSGSMAQINTQMLADSVNQIIHENKEKSEIIFYGAKFSDSFTLFADGINGNDVKITKEQLKPDGMTALISSFARMIRIVDTRINNMNDVKPKKVIFILLSDGEQTISRLNDSNINDTPYEGRNCIQNLRSLVQNQQENKKWEFMFLGTNFDSISLGSSFGIDKKNCINYEYSTDGIKNVMRSASNNVGRSIDGNYTGFLDNERKTSINK